MYFVWNSFSWKLLQRNSNKNIENLISKPDTLRKLWKNNSGYEAFWSNTICLTHHETWEQYPVGVYMFNTVKNIHNIL